MSDRHTECDDDAQPFNQNFNAARRMERDISELLGLAKGLLADGQLSIEETGLLADWIRAHPDATGTWPGSALASRLTQIYADGTVTEEERDDLRELLSGLVGGKLGILAGLEPTTSLPLDSPPPQVLFQEKTFVLTGKFVMGPRAACERLTALAGGQCETSVTKRTSYLVIGTFASRDWIHSTYGRKIEKAMEYRDSGQAIAIISEEHWADAIPSSV